MPYWDTSYKSRKRPSECDCWVKFNVNPHFVFDSVERYKIIIDNSTFNPKKWIEMMSSHGHGGHIGFGYHDHGDDWVELALPWRKELVGDVETGILASGPIISMMDNATSLSVWARLGTFRPQVTLDLRVDYMRAAAPEKTVYGRGECYQIKRSIAFVRGIAHDGDPDDPIAHVAGTFINMDTGK